MFRRLHNPGSGALRVFVDGLEVEAVAGETVATVLMRTEPFHARKHPVSGRPRAPYCLMGVCFDCLVMVDGVQSVQSCLTPVRDGMRIERSEGRWKVPA